MLTELSFPGWLVGGALAFEQLVAASRILFGRLSDSRPLAGLHRLPYIWIGTAAFALLTSLVVPLTFRVHSTLQGGPFATRVVAVTALCSLFALYGLAISMASTPYLALVIDRTGERERSRAVGLIWSMLTVGIVVGAITINLTLRSLVGVSDPALLEPVLSRFMQRVAVGVVLLTLLATWGMEPSRSQLSRSQDREDSMTLPAAWRLIRSSAQVLTFFAFLVLFTLAVFLQDPILESFGAEVFGLSIPATASLNAYWGLATLAGLLLSGFWLIPWLGKFAAARLGCRAIVASLVLLIAAGLFVQVPLLYASIVSFGLAVGVATSSALTLMLDFTLPAAAGTFVGVWGLGQAYARAGAKLAGGSMLDVGRALFPGAAPVVAYGFVLGLAALMGCLALAVLARLSLSRFRSDASASLGTVLSHELG
ncbi:BCD family MFS transporter [Synechococcus sp. RSCCF101]|uniref:BCD family MFS transporter n=1 Tax=Synechococcus sp. RSCCF101 TaxID=2511069 RepID=UPI00351A6D57